MLRFCIGRGRNSAKDGSSHHEERNVGNDSKSDGSATADELGIRVRNFNFKFST
jgi:hypothetical protein